MSQKSVQGRDLPPTLATETGATWLPRNSVQPEQERRPRPAPAARQEEEAMQGPEKESSKKGFGRAVD